MEWLRQLNNAIEYIESNLDSEISGSDSVLLNLLLPTDIHLCNGSLFS